MIKFSVLLNEYREACYREDSAAGKGGNQEESAEWILRELTDRRDLYEQTHGAKRQAARNLEAAERRGQLAECREPILQMFDEIKTRLDEISTSAHRDAVAGDDEPVPPGE